MRLKTWLVAALGLGCLVVLFALSKTLWLSVLLMAVVGFGIMQALAGANTIIQTLISDEKRGRVMSYYTMAVAGATPFGSLAIGAVASRLGAPLTLVAAGLLCLVASIWFTTELPKVRAVMRPIYRELGLLPARDLD